MKKIFSGIFICLSLILCFILGSCTKLTNTKDITTSLNKHNYTYAVTSFQGVANYIHKHGTLPGNFITKEKAEELGWEPGKNLWDHAPKKSIGGDIFTNSEKSLPDANGRVWHECDINYHGGHRGSDRLVYSNDGLIYGTSNHYRTFKKYY